MKFNLADMADKWRITQIFDGGRSILYAKLNCVIKLFEEKQVRTVWEAKQENWYISIVDVIEILTGTDRPRKYWSDLKAKLKKEVSELSDKIGQLKMQSADGKRNISPLRV